MNKPIPLSDKNARDVSFDYLRAFVVLLVVLHHSVLAYVVVWPAQSSTFEILPAPIVDAQRWLGFDVFTTFNDTFFMALMFLLSGLFVWPGLERKGAAKFLRERILRLGLPFVVAVGILMPLAYYPTYAVTGADPGLPAYARAWLSLGIWPSGPAWFIWLLLAFDAAAAGLHALRRRLTPTTQASPHLDVNGDPLPFVVTLLVVSALGYVAMELAFSAERWLTLGPLTFQASRLLLYASYFWAGIQIGARGTDSGLLARNAGLARQWPIWLSAALAAFALQLAIIVMLVLPLARAHQPMSLSLHLLRDLTFVVCCGTISFAFIGLFRRFVIADRPTFDSLSASSYGVYLVHYPIVIWLQFALLTVPLGPIAKGVIVCCCAVMLSWGIVGALRRVPMIARVL
jgi:peptidoglycan/LPS O-acetylase OafA/YrhL